MLQQLLPRGRSRSACLDKVDDLGWATGAVYVGYGTRVGVRSNDPALLERAAELLPYGLRPATGQMVDVLFSVRAGPPSLRRGMRNYNLLYADGALAARSLDVDPVLEALERYLQLAVAGLSRSRVFVHAGVVARGGGALVLPGPSRSGKSNLVRALIDAGATYYSDEYALLDAKGRVHPFLRPLSLRSDPDGDPERIPPEAFGAIGSRPVDVRAVLVTRYREGAQFRPRKLSPGQAVLELMVNTVPARRRPEVVMQTLRNTIATAHAVKGARGEAEQVAERVLALLDA